MNKTTIMKALLAAAIGVGLWLGIDAMRDAFAQHGARAREALAASSRGSCKLALVDEAYESIKLLYGLGGVPDASLDAAFDEGIELTCACVVDAAGPSELGAFIAEPANRPVLERCGEKSTESVLAKYATP